MRLSEQSRLLRPNKTLYSQRQIPTAVIPAKAEIQWLLTLVFKTFKFKMDSRLRGNDEIPNSAVIK